MGIFERCHASASAVTLAWIGVCIAPGTIVFTRILLLPHSIATALVIVRLAPLLALAAIIDRKRVDEGKCVSVRVDLGGRRTIHKHRTASKHITAYTNENSTIHTNNNRTN